MNGQIRWISSPKRNAKCKLVLTWMKTNSKNEKNNNKYKYLTTRSLWLVSTPWFCSSNLSLFVKPFSFRFEVNRFRFSHSRYPCQHREEVISLLKLWTKPRDYLLFWKSYKMKIWMNENKWFIFHYFQYLFKLFGYSLYSVFTFIQQTERKWKIMKMKIEK